MKVWQQIVGKLPKGILDRRSVESQVERNVIDTQGLDLTQIATQEIDTLAGRRNIQDYVYTVQLRETLFTRVYLTK